MRTKLMILAYGKESIIKSLPSVIMRGEYLHGIVNYCIRPMLRFPQTRCTVAILTKSRDCRDTIIAARFMEFLDVGIDEKPTLLFHPCHLLTGGVDRTPFPNLFLGTMEDIRKMSRNSYESLSWIPPRWLGAGEIKVGMTVTSKESDSQRFLTARKGEFLTPFLGSETRFSEWRIGDSVIREPIQQNFL